MGDPPGVAWDDLPPTVAGEDQGSRAGPIRLTLIGPDGVSSRTFGETARITIGRSPHHPICLNDPEVSRDHAVLTVGPVSWLEDRDSANGTWLGEEKLPPRTPKPLSHGQSFRIGKTLFALLAESVVEGLSPEEQRQRERILDALNRTAGNQKEAAQLLGISRRTLSNWLDRYQIPRPRKRGGPSEG